MTFGEKVREVRGRLQLTQKQLGQQLGIKYYTINRWEKGHHHPTFLLLRRFEDFCDKHGIKFELENNGMI